MPAKTSRDFAHDRVRVLPSQERTFLSLVVLIEEASESEEATQAPVKSHWKDTEKTLKGPKLPRFENRLVSNLSLTHWVSIYSSESDFFFLLVSLRYLVS